MTNYARNPRGQQRDKIFRESLRLELAELGDGTGIRKLRAIARTLIEKAEAGDLPAIRELADRLDGRPAQLLEHAAEGGTPIERIVHEIVYLSGTPVEDDDAGPLLEWHSSGKNGGGNGAN
jgi:hypothetical protein